ncbi:hypothetical protein D9M68_983790 [compost metagenome]
MADMSRVRILPIRDNDGRQLPRHWITRCGYKVLPHRLAPSGVAITRSVDREPFAYVNSELEAFAIIQADKSAAPEVSA